MKIAQKNTCVFPRFQWLVVLFMIPVIGRLSTVFASVLCRSSKNRSMCTCFELLFVFIHSVATCLGARTVAAKALEWTQNHKIINHVCSDEEAVLACERFAGT